MYDNENEGRVVSPSNEVSVGEWLVTMLLMCIPFVNLVMMFVWAFGSNTKPSKANYFKAYLIMAAIGIGLSLVIILLFGTIIFGSLGSMY